VIGGNRFVPESQAVGRKMGRDIDRRASLMEFAGLSPAKSTTNAMGHRPHRDRGGGC
jgi:hypothetical protein